jgi:hypothetical protein
MMMMINDDDDDDGIKPRLARLDVTRIIFVEYDMGQTFCDRSHTNHEKKSTILLLPYYAISIGVYGSACTGVLHTTTGIIIIIIIIIRL